MDSRDEQRRDFAEKEYSQIKGRRQIVIDDITTYNLVKINEQTVIIPESIALEFVLKSSNKKKLVQEQHCPFACQRYHRQDQRS